MSNHVEVIDAFLEIGNAAESESSVFRWIIDLICKAVRERDPRALKDATLTISAAIEEGEYSAIFARCRNAAWDKWRIDSYAVVGKLNTLTAAAVAEKSLQEALFADSMRSLVVSLVQLNRYGWNTAKHLFNDRIQAVAEKLEAVKERPCEEAHRSSCGMLMMAGSLITSSTGCATGWPRLLRSAYSGISSRTRPPS